MTDVANYLRRITNDLETVCKKVLPDGFMVPKFSAQNFNAYSNDEVLKTILQDFLIMERTALDLDNTYSIKLSIIKTNFLTDWYATIHIGDDEDDVEIGELMGCITIDDMVNTVR